MRRLAILLAALTLITGCGGGTKHAAAPTPTPTPTVSPTPSPPPGPMTLAQARVAYLRIVKPDNASIGVLNKALDARPFNLTKARRAAGVCEKAEHTFASQLSVLLWPTRVAPTVNKFVDALAAEVVSLRGMAEATSRATFDAYLRDFDSESSATKYAELLRTQIGLPPA